MTEELSYEEISEKIEDISSEIYDKNTEIEKKQEELDILEYELIDLRKKRSKWEEMLAEACLHNSMVKISDDKVVCRLCDKELPLQMFIDF